MSKAKFIPQRKNANRHTQRGLRELEKSIQRDGWIGAVTVAADGETFDGSARIETLENVMPDTEPIVVDVDGNRPVIVRRTDIPNADDPRAKRLAIGANRIAQIDLEWDTDVLAEIAAQEGDLLKGLFNDDELAELIGQGETKAETADVGELIDKAAELQKKWGVVRGDIWECGRHRLMCGDSTSAEDLETLMQSDRWDLIVTSPPYNSGDGGYKTDYHGKTKKFYVGKTDDRTEAEYISFCDQILLNCANYRRDDASVIVWNCVPTARARKAYGVVLFSGSHPFTVKETIIWDKGHGFPSASRGILSRQVELIFVLSAGQTYNTTQGENEPRWNVWKIDRPLKQDEIHRATFPIELPLRAIHDLSFDNAVLFEPFSGVGTVIVAAEKTNRTARAMEIEPAYCSATLERLSLLGLTPKRISTNE